MAQPYERHGRLVYFASPLTHPDLTVRQERTNAVCRACGWFMCNRTDLHFLSPIAAVHEISRLHALPYEWKFWAAFDECMLSRCDEMWILCIPGWKKSTGVTAEREIAKRHELPLKFVVPQPDQTYVVTDVEPEENA